MRITLTQEQELVRRKVREFAERELAPLASKIDETKEFPWATIRKMAKLNLLGMTVPKKYGGAGADTVSYAIAVEELARKCATTAVIMAGNISLVCHPILTFGTEEQKQRFLVPLARGEKLGALAITEAQAGSDVSSIRTTAVFEKSTSGGNGKWVLNGTKLFITNGGVADCIIVLAVTDKSKGSRGMSTFIIEKGTEGFTCGITEDKLGICASDTTELVFEDCAIPAENLLGRPGEGFKIVMNTLDGGRISVAAQAVGIAQAALDESIRYAKAREQFGKPISKFQAIQWMLADMATEIDAARLLVLRAAYKKDRGERHTIESAMAKLYASEVAVRATTKAIQIHGAYGLTKKYIVERLFRDAKIMEIFEGTSEIQRLIIANNLLKEK